MRLYLSSYRLGNHPKELLKLLDGGIKVALIANAVDFRTPGEIRERNQKDIQELTALGLDVTTVDLRKYFGKKEELETELREYDLIWVRGGNAFVLRQAFKWSGADEIIKQLLKQDTLVYGGYSAGICILSPDLHGLDLVDAPYIIPPNYHSEIIWEGLNIVPYSLVPHYKSDHPESELIDKTVDYLKAHQIPFKALRDGEVIVIKDSHETLLK